MSVGGHDRSLFQWKTHGITKPSRQFPNKEKRSRPKAAGGPGATDGPTAALKMELQVTAAVSDSTAPSLPRISLTVVLHLLLQLRELQYKLQKQNALMEEKNRGLCLGANRIGAASPPNTPAVLTSSVLMCVQKSRS